MIRIAPLAAAAASAALIFVLSGCTATPDLDAQNAWTETADTLLGSPEGQLGSGASTTSAPADPASESLDGIVLSFTTPQQLGGFDVACSGEGEITFTWTATGDPGAGGSTAVACADGLARIAVEPSLPAVERVEFAATSTPPGIAWTAAARS